MRMTGLAVIPTSRRLTGAIVATRIGARKSEYRKGKGEKEKGVKGETEEDKR
jgi:hypothetical protein